MHYTRATSARGTARWFAMESNRFSSAHYVISRSGTVYECVSPVYAAWHAGQSEFLRPSGESVSGANRFTIGYELANLGPLQRDGEHFTYTDGRGDSRRYSGPQPNRLRLEYDNGYSIDSYWEPYPEDQINALLTLLEENAEKYPESIRCFGHEDIGQPLGRKSDPGPAFPWSKLEEKGFPRINARTKRIQL